MTCSTRSHARIGQNEGKLLAPEDTGIVACTNMENKNVNRKDTIPTYISTFKCSVIQIFVYFFLLLIVQKLNIQEEYS